MTAARAERQNGRPGLPRRHLRHERRGQARLPAVIATPAAVLLYLALPESLLVGPRYVLPALEILLLVPLIAVNSRRLTRQNRFSRALSLVIARAVGALHRTGCLPFIRSAGEGGSTP
ncbi:hypothetical protein WN990_34295 [Kitasatospora purpeofusca]|uniref:hypothetical protein n=1 Tax=Kitasatospora purpeofusca TaxID=67352 RepID=UPI0030F14642